MSQTCTNQKNTIHPAQSRRRAELDGIEELGETSAIKPTAGVETSDGSCGALAGWLFAKAVSYWLPPTTCVFKGQAPAGEGSASVAGNSMCVCTLTTFV